MIMLYEYLKSKFVLEIQSFEIEMLKNIVNINYILIKIFYWAGYKTGDACGAKILYTHNADHLRMIDVN